MASTPWRLLILCLILPSLIFAKKKADDAIEEVDGTKLELLIDEEEYLAVFYYSKACKECPKILAELEKIDGDSEKFGIPFVRISEKPTAKKHGIEDLPALVYYRNQKPSIYEGDLMDEEKILIWLTDFSAMELPDEIEEVNAKILLKMIEETDYVAVLFYTENCEECETVLHHLENIDEEADEQHISFVKIDDMDLCTEYGFDHLPALVYYRKGIPLLYDADLHQEEEVFNWMLEFKDTGDDADVIELVNSEQLQNLVRTSKCLAVLFYDPKEAVSAQVLEELERVDDEAEDHSIPFVKVDDFHILDQYGIDKVPALAYFEDKIPNFYQGDLLNEEELLNWLVEQKHSDQIEDVTDEVLKMMINETDCLAVLFYDRDDPTTEDVMTELEKIDDETDQKNLKFVRIDDNTLARAYGINNELPILVYFENKIPSVYKGDLRREEDVLDWLIDQMTSDEIEEVSDRMLDMLVRQHEHIAVLFYEPKSKKAEKILRELENIDDETDDQGIVFVKTDDPDAAKKYGVEELPALVFFDAGVPDAYEGDLTKEEEVLEWLQEEMNNEDIEEVTEKTLDNLIENSEFLAVLFYSDGTSEDVLKELETIDDDTDKLGIPFVKISDKDVAEEYGLHDELPALVYFENGIPSVYEGNLKEEEQVLEWLTIQKHEDFIEEVTEEILRTLIKEEEYVLVFFAPEKCRQCDAISKELEHIDDDTDDHGIVFVTTEDENFAKKELGIKDFPAIVFFRNEIPLVYKGDIMDEEGILNWVTSEETLEIPDRIEDVNNKMLDKLFDKSQYLVVLFTKEECPDCEKVLKELENIDDEADDSHIDFVSTDDPEAADEFNINTFPTLVFFRKKFPQFFTGNLLDEDSVLKWLVETKEAETYVIEDVDRKMLDMLLDDADNLAVLFMEEDCLECDKVLQNLENIDDDTDRHGIHFVKTDDTKFAQELGVEGFPSLVYFEKRIPSIYEGDLTDEEEVLKWLIFQKTEDTIENINREMLFRLIEDQDYLSVFFYLDDEDKDSREVLKHLELIDDDCSDYEVVLVKMDDQLMAKKYGVRNPPGLVFFRKGKNIKYTGDLRDEEEILEWLTSPDNMELSDAIERVNKRMLERLMSRTDYIAALFYGRVCKQCPKVLEELEHIDDEADGAGIKFVKIDDTALGKKMGIFALPALLFFKKGDKEPVIYAGDLKNGNRILEWLLTQKDPTTDHIEDFEGPALRNLIHGAGSLAVYYYTSDCPDCDTILTELENIDDDTDRHGIQFVKTTDLEAARDYGVKEFPALIYFEGGIPSVYEGDLTAEEEVLQWLVQQKTEDTIESVNRDMLEQIVQETQYLGVLFVKPHCKTCDLAMQELENIDDDTDLYGIHLVKIHDTVLAKRYGIKTFPALVYFRNGNPLVYDGDMKNEEAVLEWLTDDDNRELEDEIETINARMLEKLVNDSPFLAVFFYDNDCPECDEVLQELENIDDEADVFGIDFVKVNDREAAARWEIMHFPTLTYFRRQEPIFYDGDLQDEDRVLDWLTCQDTIELKDEIEEVNRKMLDKILDENDFVTVFFFDNNCQKCEEVLYELEKIDDEADDLDVVFVKIKDTRYARKFGIANVPALVYFRRKFPSIYRGDLMVEDEVLEWLRKNRYRNPELNLFMYALVGITLGFILYTLFLMFCFKNKATKQE